MDKIQFLESIPEIDKAILVPTDDVAGEPLMEVQVNAAWVVTDEEIFKSWTGPRRINGDEYHGPVYALGTSTVYTGARVCACSTCQSSVAARDRKN